MKYKEFELILSSFKCNKNCPYCTAKITKWPNVDDKIDKFEEKLQYLKEKDIKKRINTPKTAGFNIPLQPGKYHCKALITISFLNIFLLR